MRIARRKLASGGSVFVTLDNNSAIALALWLIRKTDIDPVGGPDVNTGATKDA